MAKRFSFSKWQENLKKINQENAEEVQKKKQQEDFMGLSTKGVTYVFSLLLQDIPTKDIDFNAFTLEDIKMVLTEVWSYRTSDDVEWKNRDKELRYPFNKGNGFHESRFLEWSISELLETPIKIYEVEDDFI